MVVLSTHDPCEHASTPLPEVERRGRNFTLSDLNEGPLPLVTDRYLLEGWYSANAFGVPGKQYLMTDTSAQLQFGHCGTYYPVYMNGKGVRFGHMFPRIKQPSINKIQNLFNSDSLTSSMLF